MMRDGTSLTASTNSPAAGLPELFGHPTGLFTLFFAEMWERFSFYGMRALLVLYLIKGFLGFSDKDANAVYGAYTALVYMTPFFGGLIADRLLGKRTVVILGAALMSLGHLLMTIQKELWFFTALGFLIVGNGFFKPNISSIVGTLYVPGSPKRDGGFTIFYIGVNLGAALAPLICGYVGETYGWHYGFGLATIGMLLGMAVFVAPTRLTQALILLTSLVSAAATLYFNAGDLFSVASNIFVCLSLIASACISVAALGRGGLPKWAGQPPCEPAQWRLNLIKVLLGTLVSIPVFVLLVSGFSVLPGFDKQLILLPESITEQLRNSPKPLLRGLAEFVAEVSRPAGLVLIVSGLVATVILTRATLKENLVGRQRLYVAFILTFFSMWFWAFFEQSGSSVNNFTDRNIDRVREQRMVSEADVGQSVRLSLMANPKDKSLAYLSQEFLGHENAADLSAQLQQSIRIVESAKEPNKRMSEQKLQETIDIICQQPRLTMTALTYLREAARSHSGPDDATVPWTFTAENVDRIGWGGTEIPASIFQSVNAIYIMLFGLAFTAAWGYLAARGWEPSTPVKFSLGLLQVGLGFAMLYIGAQTADQDGMVGMTWLLLMYLLLTTGELCLSPVGLSMVTKLSPQNLVSTVMGTWFLATAFSQFLAAIIAQYASVNEGSSNLIPVPAETVHVYGDVYGLIAIMGCSAGFVCLAMSPLLKRWMHEEPDMAASP
ncbi:MAG: oligopeptide:H+ symporter [Pirellulaceae bacterium]|nr:oligopeptide:H+ symporter [Pirellulaceae bacterium]